MPPNPFPTFLQVPFELLKEGEPLIHVNKAKEKQRWSHGGPKGDKRTRKARVQGAREATAIVQSTVDPSTPYKCQPGFLEEGTISSSRRAIGTTIIFSLGEGQAIEKKLSKKSEKISKPF